MGMEFKVNSISEMCNLMCNNVIPKQKEEGENNMYNIFYYKNSRYAVGKEIVKTVNTENEAHSLCICFNQDGGYEDKYGNKYFVDYEEA